ncbi:MAG TPA: single-stranded DNA-binding protein [Gemmataceae bacterium]|nr:single-stranded DNA-binding protein [Gemmataceae bacterium]
MANLNKVILIGRLTRDPECRTFGNGGKVAKFGFAVTNRRKNTQTGQWEDEPMFIDCEAYNRGETGTLANVIEQYCRKGSQICIEGRLHLDQWDDKQTGQKRSKHKLVVDQMQLLDPKQDGQGGPRQAAPASTRAASAPNEDFADEPRHAGGNGEDIPF